jgi:hypothetical protein
MLHRLKRHPFPIEAHFRTSLVLTYAFPAEVLAPLLPPGLRLYELRGLGFLAIALVDTEALRPRGLPKALGCDFFLAGHRIFSEFTTSEGRTLKGLKILRSYANRRRMVIGGNALTHYRYQLADVESSRTETEIRVHLRTPNGESDLDVMADLRERPAPLPAESPFQDLVEARRFAGPLPFTFDYELETHSIVVIEGVRQHWHPEPVRVEVTQNAFLKQPAFAAAQPRLANAFLVEDIPYSWKRGVRHSLPLERSAT